MKRVERPQAINFENGIKDKPTFSAAEMAVYEKLWAQEWTAKAFEED